MTKDLYAIGEAPPVGHVPPKMHAYVTRPERFGPPKDSLKVEVLETPDIKDDEVLVYVMAAGVNYNNVWATLGVPVDVIGARNKAGEKERYHIGGSDASGVVYKVGKNVTYPKVGDEVVIHCGTWDANCPMVKSGMDPMYSPSFRIWGYETNWGSFAQFTKVQAHQCLPKPRHLTWEAAASYMLVGATAYRMLLGWAPNQVKKDDVALIWGGAGGLGSLAIQIAKAKGAVPVSVVSSTDKIQYCLDLGAKGCINRNDFDHWGMLPHWKDTVGYNNWLKGVRKFGKAIWEAVGDKRNPNIIFEHPGETTIPTSIFACETGGMVVICAGTTGYNATVDLRYLWMRQKRLQGSHFANDEQAKGVNDLVLAGHVDPCLSRAFTFEEIPVAHQLMFENKHPHGNMAVLVGAKELGTGIASTVVVHPHAAVPERHVPLIIAPHTSPAQFTNEPLEELTVGRDALPDHTPISEIMRKDVISCRVDSTIEDVVKLLVLHRIHAVVAVDNEGKPVGVISQTDIVLARQGRTQEEARQLKVWWVMTPGCLTCAPTTQLAEAVTLMTRNRVHRLLVTESDGTRETMVGILSMTDVVNKTLGFRED
jgi:crotonyl-CoA carboxylase/reductase